MIELLVNFNEFWLRLNEDIASAQQSVFVQTFAFEGDAVGKQLARALLSSPAEDKRVLADSFTRVVLNDRFRYAPANLFDNGLRREAGQTTAMLAQLEAAGIKIKFTNPYGLSPRRLLSRNHKKLIVIDSTTAYIGGINFSEHNAAWHDLMLRITDPKAVRFLRTDFISTCANHNRVRHSQFDGLELFTLDGRNNRQAFQRVLDLIDTARHTIFVESPYITFPFYEPLREATRRGVEVKIVTPAKNNWNYFARYARVEAARSRIDLRLYRGGMSHLKAMLIDDQFLIAGSSNFDYFSYRLYQEILAVITEPKVISEFRERVMLRDVADSFAVDCRATAVGKHWLSLQTRLLDAALTILT